MTTLTQIPQLKVADYDSHAIPYFTITPKIIETVPIRSAKEIVGDFWHLWAGLAPSKMSSTLIEQILIESPELPAENDPSTYEFT